MESCILRKKAFLYSPQWNIALCSYPSILLYHCHCGTEVTAWYLPLNTISVINFHVGFFHVLFIPTLFIFMAVYFKCQWGRLVKQPTLDLKSKLRALALLIGASVYQYWLKCKHWASTLSITPIKSHIKCYALET